MTTTEYCQYATTEAHLAIWGSRLFYQKATALQRHSNDDNSIFIKKLTLYVGQVSKLGDISACQENINIQEISQSTGSI